MLCEGSDYFGTEYSNEVCGHGGGAKINAGLKYAT